MNEASFCALVDLFLTKLKRYFDVYTHTNMFLAIQRDIKIGDTARKKTGHLKTTKY